VHAWQRRRHDREIKAHERELDRERSRILAGATPIVQDVHGCRFVVYPFDRPKVLDLVRRAPDLADFRAIPQLIRPGDIAFDVGANVGIYTVLLSGLCGPSGRVWAFEPVPDTYWRLRETLALNRCANVAPVQSAVCERDGTARLNLFDPQFSEWNSLGSPSMCNPSGVGRISPHQSIDVPASTLDLFCATEKIERVNFLKVDVEGFELAVFKGAEVLLRERRVDCLCFEISLESLKGAGMKSREVFEFLEACGYFSYSLDRATGKFCGPIHDTSEEWMNFYASTEDLTPVARP
jgi:FkbM family methyltransferase